MQLAGCAAAGTIVQKHQNETNAQTGPAGVCTSFCCSLWAARCLCEGIQSEWVFLFSHLFPVTLDPLSLDRGWGGGLPEGLPKALEDKVWTCSLHISACLLLCRVFPLKSRLPSCVVIARMLRACCQASERAVGVPPTPHSSPSRPSGPAREPAAATAMGATGKGRNAPASSRGKGPIAPISKGKGAGLHAPATTVKGAGRHAPATMGKGKGKRNAQLAGYPVCETCGVVGPVCEPPPTQRSGEGYYHLAIYTPDSFEIGRIAGQPHRMPRLPGNLPGEPGSIPNNCRLQWVTETRRGKGAGAPLAEPQEVVHIHVHQVRMRPRPREPRASRMWPVLLVTHGESREQQSIAQSLGVEAAADLNCKRGLSDRLPFALAKCTGDNGHVMEGLVGCPDRLKEIFDQVAAAVTAQRDRPGGAVVGLWCRGGTHRSVGVGTMLHHFLCSTGWTTELRHVGGKSTSMCQCGDGPLIRECRAVLTQLRRSEDWRTQRDAPTHARDLHVQHLLKRDGAWHTAFPWFQAAFTAHGLALRGAM